MSPGWLWSGHVVWGAPKSSKVQKMHKPMSPEWLWSGHGVCSSGTLELWGALKFQNCTNLCPQSGYSQAVLELWAAPKVPKFKNCTNLCPQWHGQGMGSAVLEFLNFGALGGLNVQTYLISPGWL